jgi:DNA polymerase-3 subunit gamma/tau
MIALARKYRPKRFSHLVAQEHVAAALRGAVASGRVGHGYLFAGPRGVGKTTAARILAMAVNCRAREEGGRGGEPCGVCESCSRIWTGSASLDVVELDAASNRGVDDARDLRERAMYAASTEQGFKVYIVDEAHMLTREAWNALLKILEEPPPRVVFVFATTEPQKILQTAAPILSRLQRFDFRRIGPQAITERLRQVLAAEQLQADDDALQLIARSADGGMRDGLSILDQVLSFGEGPLTAQRVREVLGLIPDEVYAELLRLIAERDTKAVFPMVDRLMEAGADWREFIVGAGDVLRAALLVELGGEPDGLTEGMRAAIERYRSRLPAADLIRLLGILDETDDRLRTSGNTRLGVELLLLRWAIMDRTVEIADVLRALGSHDAGSHAPEPSPALPTSGAPAPPSPTPPPLPAPRVGPDHQSPADTASQESERGPLALERMRAVWPALVASARTTNPMLAAVLADTEVSRVQDNTLFIRLLDQNVVHADGIERQRDALLKLLGAFVTGPVKIRVDRETGSGSGGGTGGAGGAGGGGVPGGAPGGGGGPGGTTAPPRAVRMTEEGARNERLKSLRAKDPALNAAIDALDLELLE